MADAYKLQLDYNKSNEFYTAAYKIIKKTNNIQFGFLYHIKLAEFYRKRAMHKMAIQQLDVANVL